MTYNLRLMQLEIKEDRRHDLLEELDAILGSGLLDPGSALLLLSGILDFFWALFFFKVRGVAGAAKNENQK